VWASVNNYISGNNITNNGNDGVNVGASSNDNIVSGNNIVSNGGGIQIGSSDNNLVLGNNITNNGYRGIWLSDSTNNTISENVMNGNKHHFYVGGIKLADFMHSIEVSNLVDGKPVYYLVNHTDLVISPLTYPHVGWLALINCSNADVKGLTFTDNGQGLLLAYTSNSRIIGNKVTNNDYGIYLESSSNCSISGNNITNNYAGIWHRCSSNNNIYENNIKANDHGVNLWDSSNSSISGNNLMNNRWCGIEVEHSSNNTIYQNNITNNGYGINLYVSLNNIINGNDMKTNYRGIVLAYSLNNSIVGNNLIGNSYGFQLDSSNYNIISGNDVTANNLAGILLRGSAYNKISRNNITNNGEGIVLQKSVYDSDSSNYNIISENNVVSNLAGIGLSYSSNNVVYHNNFINNTSQVYSVGSVNVWDDGYPSGGNYWSNYTGVDFHSGSDQDETGSDSIGDTAHEIDADNRDRYPLMAPFTTFDAGIWNGEACSVDIISNSTLSDFKLDATQKTLSFNVTGIEGKAGFCRITIPNIVVQDLWQGNYTVLLNGEPWPFRNWTDATNTYIYINYTHSEHQIIIIPEFPSAIVFPLFMIFTLVAFVLRKKRGMGHHKRGG
jgi:parallel beta-helix repeat protein